MIVSMILSWINEMNRNTHRLSPGKVVNYSMTGTSSNRSNLFVIIKRSDTNESPNHQTLRETSLDTRFNVAPFHIKKDSIVHNVIAKTIKLDGEKEDYIVSGSVLNNIGVKLKAGYTGTGYDDQVRFNKDFVSRIYIIEGIKENE